MPTKDLNPVDPTQINAQQAHAPTWTPTTSTVDPDTMTVQGQMTGLLSQSSPLRQQAETDALKQMNASGLLNSSMAVGAAQDAAMRYALPVAQQDAQTYFNQSQANQGYQNQAGQFNTQNQTQNSQFNAGQQNQFLLGTQQHGFNTQLADQAYGHHQGLADQAFGHDTQLADQAYGHHQGLADQAFGHDTQLADQAFGHNQGLADQAYGHQLGTLGAQNFYTQEQANQQFQHNQTLQASDQQFQQAFAQQQFGYQTMLAEQQGQIQTGLAQLDAEIRNNLMAQEAAIQEALTMLNQEHAIALENIRTQNSNLLNDNANAASIYMNSLNALGTALSNPQMSTEQQQAAVNDIISQTNAALEFMGHLTGIPAPQPTPSQMQQAQAPTPAILDNTPPATTYNPYLNNWEDWRNTQ